MIKHVGARELLALGLSLFSHGVETVGYLLT